MVVQYHVAHRAGQSRSFAKGPASPAMQGLVALKYEVARIALERHCSNIVQHAGHKHVLARGARYPHAFGNNLAQKGNPQMVSGKKRRNNVQRA